MTDELIRPRNEPEVVRAKGRHYVAACNRIKGKSDAETIFLALDLAEKAYRVFGLRYESGLGKIDLYSPDRFTWLWDEHGNTEHCVKIRDDGTGRVVVWPYWFG